MLWSEHRSRREWLKLALAGVSGLSASGWFAALARAAASPRPKRACILLWMNGGPSQMDTFDLKPGHRNGGPFKEIATSVAGVRISEHLPKLAAQMKHLAVIRSMTSKEGDHGQASTFAHTGYVPRGPIQYPSLGAIVAKEVGSDEASLPNYVSISSARVGGPTPGFLGPKYAPLAIGEIPFSFPRPASVDVDAALKVRDLFPRSDVADRFDARLALLTEAERRFVAQHPDASAKSHQTAYERAVKLMKTTASKAFDVAQEPPSLRDAYGRSLFGQGCLLARRLVERGVPFVEVSFDQPVGNLLGWDTHIDNFNSVKQLSGVLDPAWATLLADLSNRGLLDSTLVVWMGEFGRTPKINQNNGRDHFPAAWSAVLAGGGIKGGQVIGKTSADGMTIEDRPVTVPDLIATICKSLGIDTKKKNLSNVGRPIRIAEADAKPIEEVLR
jgi:hypothetical protein